MKLRELYRPDRALFTAIGLFVVIVLAVVAFGQRDTMILLAVVGGYFLPTIVAVSRKVPNRGSVFVINAFVGWTFIGWVVALAMAARSVPQMTSS